MSKTDDQPWVQMTQAEINAFLKKQQADAARPAKAPKAEANPAEEERDPADANGDGKVTAAELRDALDAAGVDYKKSASKAELQALYDEHLG